MGALGLYIFHILFVFPLLFYIAFFRGLVPIWVYTLLGILGIVLLVYHTIMAFQRWKGHSPFLWVNMMHILVIAPLLIYIGKNDYSSPKWSFEILALLAFAALGYNLYKVVIEVNNLKTVRPEEIYDASSSTAKPRPS
jgi:hypothetical protein